MPTHLIVAGAAFGKTQAMLALCREATQAPGLQTPAVVAGGPRHRPLLCVSSAIQRESAERRLARMGGALGVRIVLFDELYALILRTQQPLRLPVEVDSSTQRRLMRTLAGELAQAGRLAHFAPVADKPGFHSLALDLLLELEAAAIPPDALAAFLREHPASARLRDVVLLHAEWQRRLHDRNWVNRQGMGRLALEALRNGSARLPAACSPVIFDGFDSFTRIQFDLIAALHESHACAAPASGQPAADLYITLTGNIADRGPLPERRAHRRFHGTRLLLQERLGIEAEPLLPARPMETWRKPLLHLAQTLFAPARERLPAEGAVHFVEASNRALEARAALRWLKEQMVLQGVAPEECAVVARSIDPYLPHILQVAEEFGMPLRLAGGLPLRASPPVAALLTLLRALVPADADGLPSLPRRALVELWRSPYFDWRAFHIEPGDAERLDILARSGLVVGGLAQWRAALRWTEDAPPAPINEAGGPEHESPEQEPPEHESPEPESPEQESSATNVLAVDEQEEGRRRPLDPAEEEHLRTAFHAFVEGLRLPPEASVRDYVTLIEQWLGPVAEENGDGEGEERGNEEGKEEGEEEAGESPPPLSLHIRRRARMGGPLAERDLAALGRFRHLLHGMAWGAAALGSPVVPCGAFVADLAAAVEGDVYAPPSPLGAIFVAGLLQTRGVPFRALALLGMAEGEIPARVTDDPLLPDVERAALQVAFPGINLAAESAEYEFFLDTITRPDGALLLTRPRLADDGAEWEPSAFWNDAHARIASATTGMGPRREAQGEMLAGPQPEQVRLTTTPSLARVASLPELVAALVAHAGAGAAAPADTPADTPDDHGEDAHRHAIRPLLADVARAAAIVQTRVRQGRTPFDGDLRTLAASLTSRFGPDYLWSPTALETYRACGYSFLISRALRLEPPPDPEQGLTLASYGSIYHTVLEGVYAHLRNTTRTGSFSDPAALLDALERVARPLLATAPERFGFRPPPWWPALQEEIFETLGNTLLALAQLQSEPLYLEQAFGHSQPLILDPDGAFVRMRGFIDRIDRLPGADDGTPPTLCIIDYKSGKGEYNEKKALEQGKKLQIALYAAGVEQALGLGTVADGFYFFVGKGEPAKWSLATYPGGTSQAIADASRFAVQAAEGARHGEFFPQPPETGCPAWCPAASFCWHYRPRSFA